MAEIFFWGGGRGRGVVAGGGWRGSSGGDRGRGRKGVVAGIWGAGKGGSGGRGVEGE